MRYLDGCAGVPDTTDEPCRTCGGSCRSAEECDHNRFLEVRRYLVEIADRRRLTHNASEERGALMRHWPMRSNEYQFKCYTIRLRPNQGPPGKSWEYTHDQYDGPGDDRYGWARSSEEAEQLIADAIEDEAQAAMDEPVLFHRWHPGIQEIWPGEPGYDIPAPEGEM